MPRADPSAESDNTSGDCDMLDLAVDPPAPDPPRPARESSLAPPVVSNRPIGSGRSRSRSRHRHHHRRHGSSRLRFKRKESNFAAAICSMIVLVLLCTALAEPQWFYLSGGGCRDLHHKEVNYLGVNQFFYVMGGFLKHAGVSTAYKYGPKDEDVLIDCVTAQVVSIMKSVISLAFFGIVLSLAAFLLDLTGPTHKLLKVNRRNGILNILTVGFCVVINGFCYWATERLDVFQHAHKPHSGSKVRVEFSVSFFLVTAAGAMSVIAAACNLLRRHSHGPAPSSSREHDNDMENLLEDYDRQEFNPMDVTGSMACLPPPPPYSP